MPARRDGLESGQDRTPTNLSPLDSVTRNAPRSRRDRAHRSLLPRTLPMPDTQELRINGKTVRVDADRDRTLLGVLRDDLGLTGSKYGCGERRCGACTVL